MGSDGGYNLLKDARANADRFSRIVVQSVGPDFTDYIQEARQVRLWLSNAEDITTGGSEKAGHRLHQSQLSTNFGVANSAVISIDLEFCNL